MKSYILLRDNAESGPYTLRELKTLPLRSMDLIWIEGESTAWKYPTEIKELKAFVKPVANKPKPVKNSMASPKQQMATAKEIVPQKKKESITSSTTASDFYQSSYYEELKRDFNFQTSGNKKQRQFSIGYNAIGVTVFLIAVVIIAVMVKKAVDNFGTEPLVATAEAHEIVSEKLPVSNQNHAAKTDAPVTQNLSASAGDLPKHEAKSNNKTVPNVHALTAPVEDNEMKTPSTTQEADKQGSDKIVTSNTITTNSNAVFTNTDVKEEKKTKEIKEVQDVKEVKEDKSEKIEKPVGKPSLQLIANDYKVDMLGGIKNLELLLTNPSTQTIDKASVEVEYLKPNGDVVNSQSFDVFDITPGTSKKIVVPDNSRGVSIRYRVSGIDAHTEKIAPKNM